MYHLFPEIFEEPPTDHFANDLNNTFDNTLDWEGDHHLTLVYLSDINSSQDSLPHHEPFEMSAMFPSPTLSAQYSRSGSQTSIEGFRPDLAAAYLSPIKTSQSLKNVGKFECPFPGCCKRFTRRDNIKYHLKTHDQHRARPFCCDQCDKSYFRAIDLTRHKVVTHEKVKAFTCALCSQSYTRKEALRRHLEKKHSE
jgi:uncharacterized Zn-finger protein